MNNEFTHFIKTERNRGSRTGSDAKYVDAHWKSQTSHQPTRYRPHEPMRMNSKNKAPQLSSFNNWPIPSISPHDLAEMDSMHCTQMRWRMDANVLFATFVWVIGWMGMIQCQNIAFYSPSAGSQKDERLATLH